MNRSKEYEFELVSLLNSPAPQGSKETQAFIDRKKELFVELKYLRLIED